MYDPNNASAGTTSTGLQPNIAALISYILAPITSIIFYIIEKENRFVRFHAMQGILLGAVAFVFSIALSILGTILAVAHLGILNLLLVPVQLIFSLAVFVLWILCLVKSFQGQMFKIPVLGDQAEHIISK